VVGKRRRRQDKRHGQNLRATETERLPGCYPLLREPTIKSSQEDGHVLRRAILLAAGNDQGREARRAQVGDRASAAERPTRSPAARDGQAKGSRARAGSRLSG